MEDGTQGFVGKDEVILRRCLNKPNEQHVHPVDLITGKPKMGVAGFRLNDGEDGASCYREVLLNANGQTASAVSKNGSSYVFAFEARVVKEIDFSDLLQGNNDIGWKGWDVIYNPVPDEPGAEPIGHAHALVAPYYGFSYNPKDRLLKKSFNLVRSTVIEKSEVVFAPVEPSPPAAA
ncbi:hypothetical protein VSH64_34465 [Amycolatopsis rhabdoformis]|uniref:Uncharacterized protein n=1 Tax=Amycolatopsis rhabdoformis TaxID=1448059 RepID=A0ABZ1I2W7_9PSEU|nr:hypothetical protein [Amycolatopsis rhabdoformis]WSE27923.1 hypothetical protein VSH64_34465 [Amycolatopsis rhabdoformis]